MNKRDFEKEIYVDLKGARTYGEYLRLGDVLNAQTLASSPPHHDEMLFIIQHQTSELWMKLMLHELDAVVASIKADRLEPSFKMLARVGQIQRMLFEQWSVLETLTPNEYLQFRDSLGRASGFQSYQYRALEFVLGNKDAQSLGPHRHDAPIHAWLEGYLKRPSVYDEYLRHLGRRGLPVPQERLERDWTLPYEKHPGVEAVFKTLYEDTEKYWDEYEMCEKLVDLEERFQLWRFRHMKTVERIIGFKRGTGGSSGVSFLKKALDLTFFPELWDVRTSLEAR